MLAQRGNQLAQLWLYIASVPEHADVAKNDGRRKLHHEAATFFQNY
jgi:hypothetical protein